MKIFITGATGFIGSALAVAAAERGHEVLGLALPAEIISPGLQNVPGVKWLRGTLEQAPWNEIAGARPDVCVHTAWVTTPGVYLESPDNYRFLDQSIAFLRRMVDLGVKHIAGVGTCIEYKIGERPLSEEGPIQPTTTYSRCKNELRLALERDAASMGFALAWARIFYPYGVGEHPSRLCSSILARMRRDEPVILKTPNSTKDYIYVRDVATALLTVAEKRWTGSINIGTGIGASVLEIANQLGDMLGKRSLVQPNPSPEPDPFPFVVADASRLKKLGWSPAFDLRKGLEQLVSS